MPRETDEPQSCALRQPANRVEGFYSILKRRHYGICRHWSRKYMGQRYLREHDWRYNMRALPDIEHVVLALKLTSAKRMMLKAAEPKGKAQTRCGTGRTLASCGGGPVFDLFGRTRSLSLLRRKGQHARSAKPSGSTCCRRERLPNDRIAECEEFQVL